MLVPGGSLRFLRVRVCAYSGSADIIAVMETLGTVSRRFRNARAALKRHGAVEYVRRLLRHAKELVYKRHAGTVFRLEMRGTPPILEARIPVQFEAYTPERLAQLNAFLGAFVRSDVIEARLAGGWMPMLCYCGDRLVALSWFATVPIYLESLECMMDYGPGVGHIEGSRTDESVMGKGLAPAIRSRICRHLYEAGCREVYVCAGDDNVASRAVARKCGFVPFESIVLTRLLWHRRYRRERLGGHRAGAEMHG